MGDVAIAMMHRTNNYMFDPLNFRGQSPVVYVQAAARRWLCHRKFKDRRELTRNELMLKAVFNKVGQAAALSDVLNGAGASQEGERRR